MKIEIIETVISEDASEFLEIMNMLKQTDMYGDIGETVNNWQCDYMCRELQYWISMWEEDIATSPEIAALENPPRQEAIEAARTLIKFFKLPDPKMLDPNNIGAF